MAAGSGQTAGILRVPFVANIALIFLCGIMVHLWDAATYIGNDKQMCNCHMEKNDIITDAGASTKGGHPPAKEKNLTLDMKSQNHPCTLERIKKYSLENDFFPNQTNWLRSSASKVHYQPGWCKFNQVIIDGKYVEKCLKRNSIRKIAILGDSNGGRFLNELRYLLKDCRLLKAERNETSLHNPNPEYYTDDPSAVVWHARGCRHCHGSLFHCPQANLHLEFISGEYVIDTEIFTVRVRPEDEKIKSKRLCDALGSKLQSYKGKMPCVESHNSQQFILKEHLAENYPDLFLYFSNNHDRQIFTADEFGVYNRLLGGLLDLYLPDTTKFVWMTKLHEEKSKMPRPWADAVYEDKYSANEQVQRMNRRLYQTSLEYLRKRDNFYPFFDLQSMGVEVADIWADDGVHKKRPWYTHVVSYIFQALCEK